MDQLFMTFYFVMTGFHALHMIVGLCVLGVLALLCAARPFLSRISQSDRNRRALLALR